MNHPDLLMHPDIADMLREHATTRVGGISSLMGFRSYANQTVPKFRTRYVPPEADGFFEYDESDHEWLEFFGYGRREETDEPVIYAINFGAMRYRLQPLVSSF